MNQYKKNCYRENVKQRRNKQQYITQRYKQCVVFRERQKQYITKRYRKSVDFRVRHRELMRQRMRDMYKNNLSFRSMRKMRCALRITRKYRRIIKPPHGGHRENENPLITEAISIFRSHIKAGPTYVCTVCHKASCPKSRCGCGMSDRKICSCLW